MGWRLFCAFVKLCQAPFWTVTMAAAVIEMLLLGRFLKKYVPYQTTGLFLSYPVLIFVYMVSGLRQAMAICIFLGLVLPFYLEKKWIQYVIGVLIAASFHKVGYGWLVLVIAYYIPDVYKRQARCTGRDLCLWYSSGIGLLSKLGEDVGSVCTESVESSVSGTHLPHRRSGTV